MKAPVTLGVKIAPGPIKRHRINEYDYDCKLSDLKEDVSKQTELPMHVLDFIHHGRVLDDQKTLRDNGIKPGEVIFVFKKDTPDPPKEPPKITEVEIQDCVSFFRSFKHPAESVLTLLLKIRDQGHSETFISSMPALAEDPVAINFLREPELLAHMGDPDTIRKIAEKHPALIEAIQKISGIKDNKPLKRDIYDSEDEEEVDEDVEGDEDGLITPQQLSSALALAAIYNSESRSSISSGNDSTLPGDQDILRSLLAPYRAQAASQPSPSSSRSVITEDMFSNALSQAISNVSGNTSSANSSAPPADTPMSPEDTENARLYSEHLEKMQEMGLTNQRLNLRALVICNGDVNAAINLVTMDLL